MAFMFTNNTTSQAVTLAINRSSCCLLPNCKHLARRTIYTVMLSPRDWGGICSSNRGLYDLRKWVFRDVTDTTLTDKQTDGHCDSMTELASGPIL